MRCRHQRAGSMRRFNSLLRRPEVALLVTPLFGIVAHIPTSAASSRSTPLASLNLHVLVLVESSFWRHSITALFVGTAPSSTAGLASWVLQHGRPRHIFRAAGAPSASAAKGSIYSRTDGGLGEFPLYVNSSGSTTWTPIPAGVGVSQTCTVNTASPLTLIFTNGILTGGTCNT